jgi:hypothetical protein
MAIDDDKRRIPSLVPPNGGRAPGGPFDPASFTRPAAGPAPAAAVAAEPAAAPQAYNAGRGLRRMLGSAVTGARDMANRGIAAAGDAAVAGYGAADNLVRGAVGAAPAAYPQRPVTGAFRRAGIIPEPTQRPAIVPAAATPVSRAGGMVAAAAPTLATVTPETAANAAQLRGLTRPAGSPVRSGVATTAGTPAVSDSGRPLGYGNRVDGVNVFSDGSGNGPAATMTRPQIDALATGSRLSRADAGIGGGIASEAAGRTLELGSAEGIALSRPAAGAAAPTNPAATLRRAQRDAHSDLASIASGDTRSVVGRAARQLRRDGDAEGLQNLQGAVAGGIPVARDVATSQMEQEGATQRAGMAADSEVARAALTRPAPSPIDLADGTLGALGQDGVVRPITDASGQPARRAQTSDDAGAKRSQELADALAKQAGELLAATVPVGQAPTPEQIAGARLQAAQLNGLRTATGPNGQKIVEINGEWIPL